jgi:hypothetical protein
MLVRQVDGYIKIFMKGNNSLNTKYLNPYVAGMLLGLILLSAFYFTGRGLGASGAMKSVVTSTLNTIAPNHTSNSEYFAKYVADGKNPMNSWLVFEILGVVLGGFLSGAFAGRLKLKVEHHPFITSNKRIALALSGGVLFGFGSQLGRGCTSGSALTGMAVFSLQGFISMIAIFGTAFIFAYFFRKNWIGG